MRKRFSLLVSFCFLSLIGSAQRDLRIQHDPMGLQYGFTLKCSIEFGFGGGDSDKDANKTKHSIRFSAGGGVSSNFIINELHPSLNVDILFYHGGLGSRRPGDPTAPYFNLDVVTALTLTAGLRNVYTTSNEDQIRYRLSPLYYFSNLTYPSLHNPYNYSVSLGTNWIISTDSHKSSQRVGFLNVNLNKIQISYYNDGGPLMGTLGFGDGRDRYYTGGGVISYHGRTDEAINLVELSFDKFTGFSKYAFEVSNALDLGFVDYKEKLQGKYNKSLYTLNVANVSQGWYAFVKSYNWSRADVQHSIHSSLFNAFHVIPYQSFVAVGGQFLLSHLKTSVR